MLNFDTASVDWQKVQGLIPVIVQDSQQGVVLMLGYMNENALAQTLTLGKVTFYSRSKQRLWTKGEESGHYLFVDKISSDCDHDSLLILATPHGPTCHQGTRSCFADTALGHWSTLALLEQTIAERAASQDVGSYTHRLLAEGIKRIAQKVGEEGVEVALAAVAENDEDLCNEVADLFYHTLVLLQARGLSLAEISRVLQLRHSILTNTFVTKD